ncbi:dTMP kinase [Streptomyces similanensis]|uniref:Thymidylate kinase-like domain-containing protein n=1 Tax=Streptomyces similanensis TaxID=1274988 RepID=A0ABP9L894_9ACTN
MTDAFRLPSPYQPIYCEGGQGPLVVLEGVSGVGKSTLRDLLVKRMEAAGIHTLHTPHSSWSSAANDRLRPLPQFAFYLSGLLHASDAMRQARAIGTVVADRYISSVIACHAAVHRVPVTAVSTLMAPYWSYLTKPTWTFYLACSEETLRGRLASKTDLTRDDADLLAVEGRLPRLLENFSAVAEEDPTAVWLETDGTTAESLAARIVAHLESNRAEPDRR